MASMQQDDYVAIIEYDADAELFFGRIVNLKSPVTFYSDSAEGLKVEMKRSINEYLAVCAERGIRPEKPYSGRLNIRTTAAQHRRLAQAAARDGKSLNVWVREALKDAEQRSSA